MNEMKLKTTSDKMKKVSRGTGVFAAGIGAPVRDGRMGYDYADLDGCSVDGSATLNCRSPRVQTVKRSV